MSGFTSSSFIAVSLPTSIVKTQDEQDALERIKQIVSPVSGVKLHRLDIPTLKVGTLDALVKEADELSRLESVCLNVANRSLDALKMLFNSDVDRVNSLRLIENVTPEQYIISFHWNKIKFRSERSISELIAYFAKEIDGIEEAVKEHVSAYNIVKTNLASSERKRTGNLATRSLTSIVPPNALVEDSEYLVTHLIAVPLTEQKKFLASYESITDFVVPRSAQEISRDAEFILYAVTMFRKSAANFQQCCQQRKWIVRDYQPLTMDSSNSDIAEAERLATRENSLWNELLLLGRTSYSESASIAIHTLVLRIFVETVLRYGLPLDYVALIIEVPTAKACVKVKSLLDSEFHYLGGGAVERDARGQPKPFSSSDTSSNGMSSEISTSASALINQEYTAYVCFEVTLV